MAEPHTIRSVPALAALATVPHRRRNALTGDWVLVSPHRTQRPWQGQVERRPPSDRPRYDPACYLCPGNARAGGDRNPQYTGTFVFENDYAALRARDASSAPPEVHLDSGLLVARGESGTCRVICYSPRHDLTLPDMSRDDIRRVIDVWSDEYQRLGARADINYVQIFENKGEVMGASNPHPHGQIWAQESIPLAPARETERFAEHYASYRRTLLSDYLRSELEHEERIVCVNDQFVALVPFWAVWPFETLVISREPSPHLAALGDASRDGLADILKRLTTLYDAVFDVSFPYSAGIHQAPTDNVAHPEWHLHMHFYPPLLRSATVRKFLVGYEMMGEPQRDLTTEKAAAALRDAAARSRASGA